MTDPRQPRLLVIDDEPGMLALIERVAREAGFSVVVHSQASVALGQLDTIKFDAALVDLKMPDIGGLDVLRVIRDRQPACQVVLMTGHASVETAIDAVKLGALDYLTKPFELDRLQGVLTTVRKSRERRETLLTAARDVARRFAFHGMIGRSPAMQELFDALRRLAPHVRTVLITGETGTGKELVANALHKLGGRRDRRFLTINCAAVVDTLFESELFGHVRGAFTGATETKAGLFETADGGTLFLDEVGELSLSLQAKLLRAVERGEVQRVGALDARTVDVNIVAATNRDLLQDGHAGRFRSDLYYRLSVVEIRLPPLRDRREDIPYLTAAFINLSATRQKKLISGVTAEAERLLLEANWPGNIRELQNVIERACLMSEGPILNHREVLAAMPRAATAPGRPVAGGEEAPRSANASLLRTAEREHILKTLEQAGGNKARAARLLGVSRRALYRWLDQFEKGSASHTRH